MTSFRQGGQPSATTTGKGGQVEIKAGKLVCGAVEGWGGGKARD